MRGEHDSGRIKTDPELDKLWAKEAERRIDAYEQGRLQAISLEQVMEKYDQPSPDK